MKRKIIMLAALAVCISMAACGSAKGNDSKAAKQASSGTAQDISDDAAVSDVDKVNTGVVSHAVYDKKVMNFDFIVDSAEEYEIFKGIGGEAPEFNDIDFDRFALLARTGGGSSGDEYSVTCVLVSGKSVTLNVEKVTAGTTDDYVQRWFYAIVSKEDLPADTDGWTRPSEADLSESAAMTVAVNIEPESFDTAEYVGLLEKYEAFDAVFDYMGSNNMMQIYFVTKNTDRDSIEQDIRNCFTTKISEEGVEFLSIDEVSVPNVAYDTPPENYDSGSISLSIPLTKPSSQSGEAADYIEKAFGQTGLIDKPEADRIETSFELEDFPSEKVQDCIETLQSADSKFDTQLNDFRLRYYF